MAPVLGELVGTFLLVLLGNGVVANVVLSKSKGNNSGWLTLQQVGVLRYSLPSTRLPPAAAHI